MSAEPAVRRTVAGWFDRRLAPLPVRLDERLEHAAAEARVAAATTTIAASARAMGEADARAHRLPPSHSVVAPFEEHYAAGFLSALDDEGLRRRVAKRPRCRWAIDATRRSAREINFLPPVNGVASLACSGEYSTVRNRSEQAPATAGPAASARGARP